MAVTVRKHHQEVKRKMHADVARGENAAFRWLVGEARNNAPVQSGHLKSTVEQYIEATPDNPTAAAKVGADYGRIVDQGSAFRAPTYFWTKPLLALQSQWSRFFKT